nr:folylpolyglutamate synthase [Quercus suber]
MPPEYSSRSAWYGLVATLSQMLTTSANIWEHQQIPQTACEVITVHAPLRYRLLCSANMIEHRSLNSQSLCHVRFSGDETLMQRFTLFSTCAKYHDRLVLKREKKLRLLGLAAKGFRAVFFSVSRKERMSTSRPYSVNSEMDRSYETEDINALNVIHIAGTKGKGSTCAFTESILRSHGQRTGFPQRTGLYTSPHLIYPEERIRLNAQPLDRGLLAKYLFEVYDRLPQLASDYDVSRPVIERGPRYLQLFALLAFHVFIREKVDAVILETHNGGEYDATNVVTEPLVTAITTLGMDHIDMLGPTIQDIAWHKSGIYKRGAMALSTEQDEAPSRVLVARAQAQGQTVRFIGVDPRLPANDKKLQPSVQLRNASLAVSVAEGFLEKSAAPGTRTPELSPEDLGSGIAQFSWPGRFQIIPYGDHTTWFLDSAHNEMSVEIAMEWFAKAGAALLQQRQETEKPIRTLIFAHVNALRDSVVLLEALVRALSTADVEVHHVILSTYSETEQQQEGQSPSDFEKLRQSLQKFLPDARVWDEPTIPGAMDRARSLGGEQQQQQHQQHTLITGSQHLVGPALQILQGRGVDISGGEVVLNG